MILTGKRTFPIACILGVFIVFYMYYVIVLNKRQKMIEIILGVCITCVFILQLPIFSSFVERVLHGGVANRDIIYSRLGELFLEHPIFGAGMDEFYKVSLVGAHNEYLRVLAENGLFGFSFFIIALFLPVFNTLKTIKRHRLTMKILMNNGMPLWIIILFISLFWQILILIYAFTGNPLNTNEQIIAYFTFVGLEQASINKITYDSYELNVL
jgi:O-antigen ligase